MTEYTPWIAAVACAALTYKWWTGYMPGDRNIYGVLALVAYTVFVRTC